MFTLVIGAAGSGKSEYAERLISGEIRVKGQEEDRQAGELIYIATMQPWDQECLKRIEKHQKARAGRGFFTIERYLDLSGLELPKGSRVLLECLSNLMANELYSPEGKGKEAILEGVDHLLEECRDLTIVTNEVFSGGKKYEGDSLHYLKELAAVNRALAKKADRVVEVVCGCPNLLKGEKA